MRHDHYWRLKNSLHPKKKIALYIREKSKVKKGSYIGITVSAGESVDSIYVPSLIGKTLSEAQKILKEKGLLLGNVVYQINEDLLPNTVIDQLPRENEIVTYKKDVDLFIAQAPEKSTQTRDK